MGCDIHMYIQYRNKKNIDTKYDRWNNFGERINPGRNYEMFGILSSGVRKEWNKSFDSRGLPKKFSSTIDWNLHIPIRDENDDPNNYGTYTVTLEQIKNWGSKKIVYNSQGKPYKVVNPDWHSHNYLTVDEYAKALKWYREQTKYEPPVEYKALLKAMRELENKGKNEVMVVFWFDN